MNAIITKYHGPGNVRGSRVSATLQHSESPPIRITIPWDDARNSDANHLLALRVLLEQKLHRERGRHPNYDSANWREAGLGRGKGRVWVFVQDLVPPS